LEAWQSAERGRFALWLPVCMASGILCYFSLRSEPPFWLGAAVALPAICVAVLWDRGPVIHGTVVAVAAAAIGFAAAQIATTRAPAMDRLPTRAGIVTGVARSVEVLPNGRRITLEAVRIDGAPPLSRWLRVRLKDTDQQEVSTGDTVRVRALLWPPSSPAYPGAWDLQRDAWFSGQGGSGYALGSIERVAEAPPGSWLRTVQRLREVIARHIMVAAPGAGGAVSVTLLTGVTTGIPPPDRDAFRDAGLAHLLAVAGLHIGIVMGWVLTFSRLGFAASEYASLHWPTKQLAALIALIGGAGYMVLTGMHVPIVRAFAMACLYTIAVLAGRRAISLRGVALAASVLMLIEPEAVPGVSFQMSFAAVLALIAGYDALRPKLRALRRDGSWPRRFMLYVMALALTSFLAGTASAPFAAYHFGRIQLYFVLANMIAVPIAALWVMPVGLIALVLMPLGLDRFAFVLMGWGADAILYVARTAAAWPAATCNVTQMPAWGLAATGFGMAWLGLWRSRLRLAGMLVIALGLVSPLLVRPADILVSDDARLIAVRIHDTVFLQAVSGFSKFTRAAWLQYWAPNAVTMLPREGERADGAVACRKEGCLLHPLPDARSVLLVRADAHPDDCREISLIVSAQPARGICPPPWPRLVDRFTVWRNGAAAIWLEGGRVRIVTDRDYRGDRPWVPPVPTPRPRPSPTLPPAQTAAAAED
jgi:competence protein ComEC